MYSDSHTSTKRVIFKAYSNRSHVDNQILLNLLKKGKTITKRSFYRTGLGLKGRNIKKGYAVSKMFKLFR